MRGLEGVIPTVGTIAFWRERGQVERKRLGDGGLRRICGAVFSRGAVNFKLDADESREGEISVTRRPKSSPDADGYLRMATYRNL
jgi:hypothetical protein